MSQHKTIVELKIKLATMMMKVKTGYLVCQNTVF